MSLQGRGGGIILAPMSPLETLYQKYYRDPAVSAVTSSHWAGIGEAPVLNRGEVEILGKGGFGDFVPATFGNRLHHLPYSLLVDGYVRRFCHDRHQVKTARDVARRSGRIFLLDCAKHVVVVETALRALGGKTFTERGIRTVAIIGDGYGYLGNLLRALDPKLRIVFVNLGKQLLFDLQISRRVHPDVTVRLVQSSADLKADADFYFLEAEQYHLLEGAPVDLFFNIASMQEMNKVVVDEYFRLMRSADSSARHFYTCNRAEKTLPDGEVIRFSEYHWNDAKVLWEERDPPWYRTYPARTPPFWRPFDGRFTARLVRF